MHNSPIRNSVPPSKFSDDLNHLWDDTTEDDLPSFDEEDDFDAVMDEGATTE